MSKLQKGVRAGRGKRAIGRRVALPWPWYVACWSLGSAAFHSSLLPPISAPPKRTRVRAHARACARTHAHTHRRTHTHSYTQIHTHALVHTDTQSLTLFLPDPSARTQVYHGKAQKYRLFYSMHQLPEWKEMISGYKAVMTADDDLVMSTCDISRAFETFDRYGLWLAQMSLCDTKGSWSWWRMMYQQRAHVLRYVTFVEIMAPIFTTRDGFYEEFVVPTFYDSFSGEPWAGLLVCLTACLFVCFLGALGEGGCWGELRGVGGAGLGLLLGGCWGGWEGT